MSTCGEIAKIAKWVAVDPENRMIWQKNTKEGRWTKVAFPSMSLSVEYVHAIGDAKAGVRMAVLDGYRIGIELPDGAIEDKEITTAEAISKPLNVRLVVLKERKKLAVGKAYLFVDENRGHYHLGYLKAQDEKGYRSAGDAATVYPKCIEIPAHIPEKRSGKIDAKTAIHFKEAFNMWLDEWDIYIGRKNKKGLIKKWKKSSSFEVEDIQRDVILPDCDLFEISKAAFRGEVIEHWDGNEWVECEPEVYKECKFTDFANTYRSTGKKRARKPTVGDTVWYIDSSGAATSFRISKIVKQKGEKKKDNFTKYYSKNGECICSKEVITKDEAQRAMMASIQKDTKKIEPLNFYRFLRHADISVDLFEKSIEKDELMTVEELQKFEPELWIEKAFEWPNSCQDLHYTVWSKVNNSWKEACLAAKRIGREIVYS